MEERRSARVGTVSGLALLTGGTAVAAVAGGAHSIFATVLLGLLALGMGHALLVEIRRQAGRRTARWARQDTVNGVLLGCWAEIALIMTIVGTSPLPVRVVGAALTVGYAGSCGYFVTQRRRAIAAQLAATRANSASSATAPANSASTAIASSTAASSAAAATSTSSVAPTDGDAVPMPRT